MNNPELAFHPDRWCGASGTRPSTTTPSSFVREREAMRFNDGSSSDPWRDGAMGYLSKTGRPEGRLSVRSNFRGKGIGSQRRARWVPEWRNLN